MHDVTATLSHVVCQGPQGMPVLDSSPARDPQPPSLEIPQPASSSAEIAARLLDRRLSIGAARLLLGDAASDRRTREPSLRARSPSLAASFMDSKPTETQEVESATSARAWTRSRGSPPNA
jgi:hypothetical protein